MIVKSSGGRIWASPCASFAPPTPPARATIFNLNYSSRHPRRHSTYCAPSQAHRVFKETEMNFQYFFFHVILVGIQNTQEKTFPAAPMFQVTSKSFEWSFEQTAANKPKLRPSLPRARRARVAARQRPQIEPPSCILLCFVFRRDRNR